MKKETCKNCKNWKSEQAEIEYRIAYGFCTCKKHKFNTTDGCDVMVLDRNNKKNNFPAHQFESLQSYLNTDESQYCLVTSEDYGCINFENKIKT